MKKIFALAVLLLAVSTCAFADRESRFVREEAARRNLKLISIEQVRDIVAGRFDGRKVRVKEIELEDEADDYYDGSDFRPVYQVECISQGQEYDIDIDAVTGKILKFKRDD